LSPDSWASIAQDVDAMVSIQRATRLINMLNLFILLPPIIRY